jgi:hypothetical protein
LYNFELYGEISRGHKSALGCRAEACPDEAAAADPYNYISIRARINSWNLFTRPQASILEAFRRRCLLQHRAKAARFVAQRSEKAKSMRHDFDTDKAGKEAFALFRILCYISK